MNREERACYGSRNHNSGWGEKAGCGFGLGTELEPDSADGVGKLPFLNWFGRCGLVLLLLIAVLYRIQ